MIPEVAEPWKGKINEEITVTFTQEGIYGYKCQPHFGLGMVGLIQVGETPPIWTRRRREAARESQDPHGGADRAGRRGQLGADELTPLPRRRPARPVPTSKP